MSGRHEVSPLQPNGIDDVLATAASKAVEENAILCFCDCNLPALAAAGRAPRAPPSRRALHAFQPLQQAFSARNHGITPMVRGHRELPG